MVPSMHPFCSVRSASPPRLASLYLQRYCAAPILPISDMAAILSARCPYLHQSGLETGGEVDIVLTPSDDVGYEDTVTDADLTHIVSSPYPQVANLLDLRPLDPQSRHLAVALAELQPTREDYATAAYLESFNWSTVFGRLRVICTEAGISWKQQEFHVVIFRSVRQKNADVTRLGLLDQMSHQEACQSGGLLKYWFGKCNDQRQNLATCTASSLYPSFCRATDGLLGIWAHSDDAKAGGRGPWHKQARNAAPSMYDTISFHTHRLVIEDGATKWRLEDYDDPSLGSRSYTFAPI